jgi:hypothetical protein
MKHHEMIHDRMTAVSDWRGVFRDIRLYELARQLAQNDGHVTDPTLLRSALRPRSLRVGL